MSPMDSERRDKVWCYVVAILCAISLTVAGAAFYGIKRLEAKPKAHVHEIREVNQIRVEPHAKK